MFSSACLNCGQPAAPNSSFCGQTCGYVFAQKKQGPVQCDECMFTVDVVKEAEGWSDIRPAPEGISYNWGGICPDCQAEGN